MNLIKTTKINKLFASSSIGGGVVVPVQIFFDRDGGSLGSLGLLAFLSFQFGVDGFLKMFHGHGAYQLDAVDEKGGGAGDA